MFEYKIFIINIFKDNLFSKCSINYRNCDTLFGVF